MVELETTIRKVRINVARPKKEIDYELASRLARIHCTNEEIASCLGVNATYWYDLLKRDPKLSEALEKARGEGRASLRRLQWQNATSGNVTMQIWLGKQILSQNDISRNEITGKNGDAIQIEERATEAREFIEAAILRAATTRSDQESHIENESETTH